MATQNILMVRPTSFGFNSETARSNSFQNQTAITGVCQKAKEEFDIAVGTIRNAGVNVVVVNDTEEPKKPDAIFPNNWFSTHTSHLFVYPMMAKNRRLEKRNDLIESIKNKREVIDLSFYENQEIFLEGTGSIVFDHSQKIAYLALSNRSSTLPLELVCQKLGYEKIVFNTITNIYHTNVLMSIGTEYALVCLDIIEVAHKKALVQSLTKSKTIIEISIEQMNAMCGNVLALKNNQNKPLVIMSKTAHNSFTPHQLSLFKAEPLIVEIPTIEKIGGGGIRCMIAELY